MNIDLDQISSLALAYGPKLVYAIIVLIVGLWIIKAIVKGTVRIMQKRNVDDSLKPFLKSLIAMLLKVMLVITVMTMLGIEMTSFIAILGAAGLAVGMALSGTLQNFAGGVMILLFKPFEVGDFIEAQGYTGSVKEIQIFNTIMTTVDNKTIFIPNGPLSTSSLINYSTEPHRRVDMTFGIGYEDDIKKAKDVLMEILDNDSRILKVPLPFIAVSELADSSVNFTVRAWVNSEDYWAVFFDTQETVKLTFDAKGISIPYPQRDIHLYHQK
ncbi:mechanosensitive ion channel [Fulvivirgaceae bacterium BMA10]|uniref:Mechanosensitive ion channel n=1 Tax=Splendidivirga corallicola TaxID=3051826 RepID=A0ABT8KWD7_9BACT|nr:mechanosensitive ion channel [Fulvivirgaceae bacterium BMA10]